MCRGQGSVLGTFRQRRYITVKTLRENAILSSGSGDLPRELTWALCTVRPTLKVNKRVGSRAHSVCASISRVGTGMYADALDGRLLSFFRTCMV